MKQQHRRGGFALGEPGSRRRLNEVAGDGEVNRAHGQDERRVDGGFGEGSPFGLAAEDQVDAEELVHEGREGQRERP